MATKKTLLRIAQGLFARIVGSPRENGAISRADYFLSVGQMQCVGFWLPRQTLP